VVVHSHFVDFWANQMISKFLSIARASKDIGSYGVAAALVSGLAAPYTRFASELGVVAKCMPKLDFPVRCLFCCRAQVMAWDDLSKSDVMTFESLLSFFRDDSGAVPSYKQVRDFLCVLNSTLDLTHCLHADSFARLHPH
jgi:hypothetical protein